MGTCPCIPTFRLLLREFNTPISTRTKGRTSAYMRTRWKHTSSKATSYIRLPNRAMATYTYIAIQRLECYTLSDSGLTHSRSKLTIVTMVVPGLRWVIEQDRLALLMCRDR